MNDPQLDDLLTGATARLRSEMSQAAPRMADQVWDWMRQLGASDRPEDYFQKPVAFPLFRLPWWLEKTLRPNPSLAFQADLVYSTMNGYYYIRLLDNLMDGHATVELKLLPAAGFFHTQFQMAYQRYFEREHPFWDFFARTWFHSAEVTWQDAQLESVDEAQFRKIASQKVCAAQIPLTAVSYRCERADLIGPWSRFLDALGGWHQMWNDVFDWNKDLRHHTHTYFLTEAERRKRPDEGVAAWVVREGFGWGVSVLQTGMRELREWGASLNSPDLLAYLDQREAMFLQQREEVAEGLHHLSKLAATMS
jgi:hypothetical protein